jgi:hypothetical protein
MIVKRNKTNNNFQIAYFIAGACFTPDAAYFALLNQRDDRQAAMNASRVNELKIKAKKLELQRKLKSADEVEALEAEAELLEIELNEPRNCELIEACQDELAFIDQCIEQVKPLRKYSHMSDLEAAEACQREEFAREFQYRIENFLLTHNTIPSGEMASMRQHPDFETYLLPHIKNVSAILSQPGGVDKLLPHATKTFDLPALLGWSGEQDGR